MPPFKTHHGASQRALSEAGFARSLNTRFAHTHRWVVVANSNSHQVAQGFLWRVKRIRK